MALFNAARSESLVLSLPCFKSSAGFKTKTTAVARTPKIAITTNNSIKVNPLRNPDM